PRTTWCSKASATGSSNSCAVTPAFRSSCGRCLVRKCSGPTSSCSRAQPRKCCRSRDWTGKLLELAGLAPFTRCCTPATSVPNKAPSALSNDQPLRTALHSVRHSPQIDGQLTMVLTDQGQGSECLRLRQCGHDDRLEVPACVRRRHYRVAGQQ